MRVNRTLWVALWLGLVLAAPLWAQELFQHHADPVSPEVERLYQQGLQYLVRTQTKEGCWSDGYGREAGVVGLAALAILAHGDDPNFGPYAEPVRRCLEYILKSQERSSGYIGSSMYNHGFATLALAEAYGQVDDPRIGPALRLAVDQILHSQQNNPLGAWRYSPLATDADTTVSGACLVALLAARNAGLAIPEKAVKRALDFYRACQSPDGGIGYTNAGGPNHIRTAIAVLVFALARHRDTANYKAAWRYLNQGGEGEGNDYYRPYYLYYAAQAYFHGGADEWERWNRQNLDYLRQTQADNGSWTGSQGETFSTAGSLLSLALNYRFLPIYER